MSELATDRRLLCTLYMPGRCSKTGAAYNKYMSKHIGNLCALHIADRCAEGIAFIVRVNEHPKPSVHNWPLLWGKGLLLSGEWVSDWDYAVFCIWLAATLRQGAADIKQICDSRATCILQMRDCEPL